MPFVAPYLFYADAPAAIEFLCRAFGFEEKFRHVMRDGKVAHAQLTHEGGTVMLASVWPDNGMASPLALPAVHSQIYCAVSNLDAHHDQARDAGATIASAPADQFGQRTYRALDPEGHRWIFAGPLRSDAK